MKGKEWLLGVVLVVIVVIVAIAVLRLATKGPLYTRLKGKSIREWFTTWGTGAGWIAMHVVWLFLIEGVDRPLYESLLWGDLSRFYWSAHFIFLIVLGTWCSWGGTGARKMVTWFGRITLLGILLFLITFVSRDIYKVSIPLPLFGALVEARDFSIPGNYESRVGSPYPGRFYAMVAPEGKEPGKPLKRFKIADVPAGTKAIEIVELGGRIHVDGRTTVFEGGAIFAQAFIDGKWQLVPLQLKDSPLFLILGDNEKIWRIMSPDEIPVDIKKDTSLYAAIKSKGRGGRGLVTIDFELFN